MLFADVGAVVVDVVAAAADCNIAVESAADERTDYSVDAADAAVEHNGHGTVVVADAAAAVADDGCTDDDAGTVAAVVDDTRVNIAAVSCRICRGVRRCYRHYLQQDDMGYRSMILPYSFAGVDCYCCCRCCSSGEEVHYIVVGISRWTRALLAGSNHWFATWARSSCEIRCSRYSSLS